MGRRSRPWLSWLLFVVVLIAVFGLSATIEEYHSSQALPKPVRVTPAPLVSPSPGGGLLSQSSESGTNLESIQVPISPVVAMYIPANGLSLRVAQVRFGSTWDPPFDPSTIDTLVYQDSSRGSNPGTDASNATYIVGHSWRAGRGAFNVIDTSLRDGDDVYVLTESSKRLGVWLHYVVTSTENIFTDDQLADKTNSTWLVTPRLVLVTCHLKSDGKPQTDKHVMFAKLVGVSNSK